jgi:hypothetical protein
VSSRRALGLAVAACLFSAAAMAQSRDWSFVQSVGGLALGVPVERNGAWHLPIRCDVSGIEAVTTRPTAINSALACDTTARVEGETIVLTVIARDDESNAFAACPPARLGRLPKGRYAVVYSGKSAERVEIGEVYIAR